MNDASNTIVGTPISVKSGNFKSRTTEYRVWSAMKNRCYRTKNENYALYGGRGIKVCDRWRNSFQNFLNDMGKRPSLRHTLDRFPDKDGDYEPSNCRWADYFEQNNNTRANVFFEYNGESKTAPQWDRHFGLRAGTIRNRVVLLGWSIERASTEPKCKNQHALA